MPMVEPVQIQGASIESLFIEMISEDRVVASGTAFRFSFGPMDFLVTARHCLTGKNADGEFLSPSIKCQPSQLRVHFRDDDGTVNVFDFELADADFNPVWLEHPRLGPRMDVAAIALPLAPESARGRWRAGQRPPMQVTDDVNIIGYPFGMKAGANLPIWARGTIATEPHVPYDDLPAFLVDSRTRTGQSGSPVVQHYRAGTTVPTMTEGGLMYSVKTGPVTRLIGVYTGRVNAESDLGLVWHMSAVTELCLQMVAGETDLVPPNE